ncbi:MAG: cellulase family glycosylhydrolase [Planctomycetota bacterium]
MFALVLPTVGHTQMHPPAEPRLTAVETSRAMGVGINLGNTFDYPVHPTDAKSAQAQISLYADAGFTNVRIPATWNDLYDTPLLDEHGQIQTDHPRFQSFEATVDHALDLGLYVTINMHHEKWLKHHFAGPDTDLGRYFAAAWTSIATHFADRSPRLIFEVINEPEGTQGDWVGEVHPYDEQALQLTRELNQLGYDAIRAVPGNEQRIVMVAPNAMGNQGLISAVYPTPESLPGGGDDRYLMVTLHTYDPWTYCGQDGSNAVYLDQPDPAAALQRDIDAMVDAIAKWAETMPVGVHWGEYGVGRLEQSERDHDVARLFYFHLTKRLQEHGWGTSAWDDRGWFAISPPSTPTGRSDDADWPFGFKDALLEAASTR